MTSRHDEGRRPPKEEAIIDLLSDRATYGLADAEVARIDTHAARVFLAGEHAYKIKRPVCYPYLDFSTPDARERALRAELRLNRRTAPELYLDVRPITRDARGCLHLDGEGEPVEWLLVMRRFRQEDLLDAMARAGRLTPEMIVDLAHTIRQLHDNAEVRRLQPGEASRRLAAIAEENLRDFNGDPEAFPADRRLAYENALRESLRKVTHLVESRAAAGMIRHCHGDLHLGNICMFERRPRLFDCLEFDPRLAEIEPLYDLAFLLMDLEEHGYRGLANRLLSSYVRDPEDAEGLALLPLFLSLRAAIRAKVRITLARLTKDKKAQGPLRLESANYFSMAARYLAPTSPVLVAIGGLSGTGKSTLAARVAPEIGTAPGALHLRSDKLRKDRFLVDERVRLPADAYRPSVSAAVYETLIDLARRALAAGHPVVADATFLRADGRHALEEIARQHDAPFLGLWLEAPTTLLLQRVSARCGDASDATEEVVRGQLEEDTGTITWQRLDASLPFEELSAKIDLQLAELVPRGR
jgi:aminoglycoside phosphotransferase family enzyme/adenylate kinase family enzyme